MTETINILIAYTAVVVTIVGGIMGFMLYHFIPLKMKVSTMWHDLYGERGHIEESEDERESMRAMLEKARDEHEDQSERLDDVVDFLCDLSEHIEEETPDDADSPPHIERDDYMGGERERTQWGRGD